MRNGTGNGTIRMLIFAAALGLGCPNAAYALGQEDMAAWKFKSIYTDVEDAQVLEPFAADPWIFSYEEESGIGRIDYTEDGLPLGTLETGSSFLDALTLTADIHIDVRRGAGNVVSVIPVLEVDSSGCGRPFFEEAILGNAQGVLPLELLGLESGQEGDTVRETALFYLPLANAETLMTVAFTREEPSLRLRGLHEEYTMDLAQTVGRLRLAVLSAAGASTGDTEE